MEDNTRICTHCGCELGDYEGTAIDDELLCNDCCDELTDVCEDCGDRIWTDEAVSDGNTTLCSNCFDNYYRRCECCNRVIHDDNVWWRNDYPYCQSCYEEHFHDEIEEYSYKPDPVFHGEGRLYLGVELEVDCGGKDDDNALRLKDIANVSAENIYIKSDGSIDDGFEIVSHPMTLDYHMNTIDWESLMHEAIRMGYRSHKTSTCGLHVHVNRNAFGANQEEQEAVIEKVLYFVEKNWNELFRFSRRTEYNMNRWSARHGYEKTGKEIMKKAKGDCNRYVAVNLRNYNTIEFRMFRGTLKYNTFIAILQMVNRICETAMQLTEQELDKLSWSEFVAGINNKELVRYLKERRLYR